MNYKKIAIASLLVGGSLLIGGLALQSPRRSYAGIMPAYVEVPRFSIYDAGESVTQIQTTDLDNDGDIDIIVGTSDGKLILYKIEIPQNR